MTINTAFFRGVKQQFLQKRYTVLNPEDDILEIQ
jgi:hypothetical protein